MAYAAPGRFDIAGIPIDAVDIRDTLRHLASALRRGTPTHVCTINFDFIAQAQTDMELKSILNRSELNLPDGFPVLQLGRLQGFNRTQRVAGADVVPLLMRLAAEHGARVFLLGGEGGVAEAAARRLRDQLPALVIAGCYEPPRARIEDMDNEAIVARINEARADVLLVALGNPKQEKWIARYRDRLPVSVAIGVGCCLDLIAGRRRRAPRWMQAVGMEWLFRLAQEPRRLFSRYLRDLGWLAVIAASTLRERWNRHATSSVG